MIFSVQQNDFLCVMDAIEQGTIIHYHQHRIDQFGLSVDALGWRNSESQQRRFEAIHSLMGDNAEPLSVLDAGCGKGDFLTYLLKNELPVSYIGIDLNADFIKYATRRYHAVDKATFYQADFTEITLPYVDVVVLSGALSYRTKVPDQWKKTVLKLYGHARKKFIFNFLDADTFPKHPLLIGYPVESITAYCQAISGQLTSLSGYIKHDTTLCLSH